MSDRFRPISMEQLTRWVFHELDDRGSLFGIPRSGFFVPSTDDRFRLEKYGRPLESPFGVAAGPHSQMAQNLVVAWVCGARFLELKTIQTLDELEINKPCIDVEDEGYNVEWSQELKVYESYDEYLRAWVLIHALHKKLGFPGDAPGMIFNMSVGYNLEGIQKPNVQWFLDAMRDCSEHKQAYVEIVAEHFPEVRDVEIPDLMSDSVTLSTMHGCPPDEIEKICAYLLTERGLHTSVKCNPTLLGPAKVRSIVNRELGFADVPIPDEAFGHDLKWTDAVPMLHNLKRLARERDLVFGVKLTNTLEVKNFRPVFPDDDMMYMSGRALHPVTVNLALALSEEFEGDLLISFAGGADCFNVPDLLRCGIATVTVCSDLLKSGGYLRLRQYFETLEQAMDVVEAESLRDYVRRSAWRHAGLAEVDALVDETLEASGGRDVLARVLARINLRQYAAEARGEWRNLKSSLRTDRSKTPRKLDLFDCIEAPCVDECPVDQKVPQYMNAVREGDFERAVELTREDNPLPTILGRVCDHLCENTCIRTHYDEPLAIREIKRFIMEHESAPGTGAAADRSGAASEKVAIIGAGPAGLSAAQKLAEAGFAVEIFEMYPYAGGMVGGAIPTYRLPQKEIDQDVAVLTELGVEIHYEQKAGVDFTLEELRERGFGPVFVAAGAQLAKRLGLPGEDATGVMDALRFLRSVREGDPVSIGRRVAVIGAGDTAMDCVRSAYRLGSEVSLVYRRTIDQMPADREEIRGAQEEGVEMVELAKPVGLEVEGGELRALVCRRMEYRDRGDRDASGRKIPHEVEGSDWRIEVDTLILAISQYAILDFFGDTMPELTDRGYLTVDPDTLETSVPGVYAGGDVAADGPSSIVKASADGKRVAAALIARSATPVPELPVVDAAPGSVKHDREQLDELLIRRARREFRVPLTHTPLDQRMNFDETILTYTPEDAMTEASRCLDCHEICSLCVGVCPNMALMTYSSEPFAVELPALTIENGQVVAGEPAPFRADQRYQIAVLTDFCNECGNCTTFCPTSGDPYRDKPRLYLDRADFEAQAENAFMLSDDDGDGQRSVIEARWGGETHRLEVDGGELRYESPALAARLSVEDFSLIEATPGPSENGADGRPPSLEPCAAMYVVLAGVRESMPYLPRVVRDEPATRISHPGYDEPES